MCELCFNLTLADNDCVCDCVRNKIEVKNKTKAESINLENNKNNKCWERALERKRESENSSVMSEGKQFMQFNFQSMLQKSCTFKAIWAFMFSIILVFKIPSFHQVVQCYIIASEINKSLLMLLYTYNLKGQGQGQLEHPRRIITFPKEYKKW
mgnify:CR=1 FL=1